MAHCAFIDENKNDKLTIVGDFVVLSNLINLDEYAEKTRECMGQGDQ
jgi:hypothetical protein